MRKVLICLMLLFAAGCGDRSQAVEMSSVRALEGSWTVVHMRLSPKPNFDDDSTWVPLANQQAVVVFEACRRREEKERACQGYSDFNGHRHRFNYHIADNTGNKLVILPAESTLTDRWGMNGEYLIQSHTETRLVLFSSDYNQFVAEGNKFSAVIELERR